MKHMLIPAFIVLFALLATGSGCVSVQSDEYVGMPTFAPTDADTIRVLRTPPTQPHLRLGEITVEPNNNNTSVQTIEEKFQKAAAKMGANAVVIVADRTELMGIDNSGPWYGGAMTPVVGRVVVGVAIRYTNYTNPPVQN